MICAECGGQSAEAVGLTDDSRTRIRCSACGFHWTHGPSAADLRAGHTGGRKFHCPVCPHVFADQTAPIITIGTPSRTGHRCDQTLSFRLGPRYGADPRALDRRLAQIEDEDLASWPRILDMKHERLAGPSGGRV